MANKDFALEGCLPQLSIMPWTDKSCELISLVAQIQSILEETLQALGAKAMVVGHTPQITGANW